MDFNTAEKQFNTDFEIIPEDTIVNLIMTIRPGHVGEGGWLTQSKSSAWQYLDCEFTVIGGEFDKRKIWQNMMYANHEKPESKAINISRATLRAILESARNIRPDDESPNAQAGRRPNGWDDFNGLQFKAKLKIEEGQNGYSDKNQIKSVITPDMAEYGQAPVQNNVAPMQTVGQAADNVVQQVAQNQAANVPAWANS